MHHAVPSLGRAKVLIACKRRFVWQDGAALRMEVCPRASWSTRFVGPASKAVQGGPTGLARGAYSHVQGTPGALQWPYAYNMHPPSVAGRSAEPPDEQAGVDICVFGLTYSGGRGVRHK